MFPHLDPHVLESMERKRQERYRQYEIEEKKEQDRRDFEMDFGLNPSYKGQKSFERQVIAEGFELAKPEKKKWKWL